MPVTRLELAARRLALALPMLALLLGAVPARADGVAPADATKQQQSAAQKKFQEGRKLLSAGKVEEAIEAFRASHEIVANPKASLMIARAHRDSGDLLIAYDAYLAAGKEAEEAALRDPKLGETLKEIQKDTKELEGIFGSLEIELIHAPKGTTVTLDGQPVDAGKLAEPLRVAPGPLTVVATTPDGRELSRQLTVSAGQAARVKLPFAREDEPGTYFAVEGDTEESDSDTEQEKPSSGGGSKALAYVAGGVGVAGLAAFGVFGTMSNSKFDELETACTPQGQCPADRRGDIDDGRRFQTFANIGLAVGVVGLGTGVALFFLSKPSDPGDEKQASIRLGVGLGSVDLSGSFR